jgi:hypothetical protein
MIPTRRPLIITKSSKNRFFDKEKGELNLNYISGRVNRASHAITHSLRPTEISYSVAKKVGDTMQF